MNLEIIILSEISQTEKDKYHMTSLNVESKNQWYKWTYLQNRNRLTDLQNEPVATRDEVWARGIDWEFGIDMYTLLF